MDLSGNTDNSQTAGNPANTDNSDAAGNPGNTDKPNTDHLCAAGFPGITYDPSILIPYTRREHIACVSYRSCTGVGGSGWSNTMKHNCKHVICRRQERNLLRHTLGDCKKEQRGQGRPYRPAAQDWNPIKHSLAAQCRPADT